MDDEAECLSGPGVAAWCGVVWCGAVLLCAFYASIGGLPAVGMR